MASKIKCSCGDCHDCDRKHKLQYAACKWITIGSKVRGDSGKKRGGTPICIGKGGSIEKGPAALTGDKLTKGGKLEAGGDVDTRGTRKQLADARGAETAKRRKEARAAGLDPNDVIKEFEARKAEHAVQQEPIRRLYSEAKRMLGVSQRNKAFAGGGDVETLQKQGYQFDDVAQSLAADPEYSGVIDTDDAASFIFDLIHSGPPAAKSDDDIWEEVMEEARRYGGRSSGGSVPFSRRGAASKLRYSRLGRVILWLVGKIRYRRGGGKLRYADGGYSLRPSKTESQGKLQWVTMGGAADPETGEKHVGGTRVLIDGEGRIQSHQSTALHGKKVGEIDKDVAGTAKDERKQAEAPKQGEAKPAKPARKPPVYKGRVSERAKSGEAERRAREGLAAEGGKPAEKPQRSFKSAGEAAKAGMSYNDWTNEASGAFVREEINEDHPAWQAIQQGNAPSVDDYNDAKHFFGKHVKTPMGHFGKVTDISPDIKTVTVTHEDGTKSIQSPGMLDELEAVISHKQNKGKDTSREQEYLARSQAAAGKRTGERTGEQTGQEPTGFHPDVQSYASHSGALATHPQTFPADKSKLPDDDISQSVVDAIKTAKSQNQFVRPSLKSIYDATKAKHPNLTRDEFAEAIKVLHGSQNVRLLPWTGGIGAISEDEKPYAIAHNREVMGAVDLDSKSGEKPVSTAGGG